jgi:membrane protein DedA with SNARE-associated domain
MGLTKFIVDFCAEVIRTLGYPGIFILMTCESMYFPIPSFAVMPFVGYVAAQGHVDFKTGVLVGALGGLFGSYLTYYFGRFAGPKGVRKWGRYAGLVEEDLDATQAWFDKRGAIAVFIARFVPVVRHFISTVAGMAKMKLIPFTLMTFAGAGLWDLFLAAVGYKLQDKAQETIHTYTKPLDALVIVVFGGGAILVVRKLRARMKRGAAALAAKEAAAAAPSAPPLDAPREGP